MNKSEKIGHYALELMKLEMALFYAKRHVNLVETDISKTKQAIETLKNGE